MLPSKDNRLALASEVVGVPEVHAEVFQVAGELRAAEGIVLGFLVYITVASFELPMSARERLTLTTLNILTTAVIFLLEKSTQEKPSSFLVAVRNWLPAVFILLAYRESGMFFIPDPAHRLDHLFVAWDSFLLQNKWVLAMLTGLAPWPQGYLELAYLFCYPLVPLGLGFLMLSQRRSGRNAAADSPVSGVRWTPPESRNRTSFRCASLRMTATPQCHPERSEELALIPQEREKGSASQSKIPDPGPQLVVDRFWTGVLLAALFCYAVYPFFPLTPPRLLFHDLPGPAVSPLLRTANFWLLNAYGVQACIFPSGHVAAVTATALAVRAYRPRLGALFLVAAASVAAATVLLRYHYGADALAGALVGWAAWGLSERIHGR